MTIVLAPPRPTNGSLLESFAEDATIRGLTKETLRAYLSYGRILAEFLASRGKGFLEVDADLLKDILRYVLSRKVKSKTVRAYFSALSAVCDYLQNEGLLPANPVPAFRKRYLREYKKRRGEDDGARRLLSVEEMRLLIGSTLDPRDRSMMLVLAKTGVRREELIAMDVDDVDFVRGAIRLKPHPKRSNLLVFFDDECAHTLKAWLRSPWPTFGVAILLDIVAVVLAFGGDFRGPRFAVKGFMGVGHILGPVANALSVSAQFMSLTAILEDGLEVARRLGLV